MASFDHQFLSTFLRRQPFDLPDSIIYYILKNPKSSKVYQKLIQSCKYFFIKNPILVFHCLLIDDDGWKTCSNQNGCKKVDLKEMIDSRIITSCCKLWIDHQIRIYSTDSKVASDLIPRIYQCDSTGLFFDNQNMSFQQFLLYAQKTKVCFLDEVIISSDIGAEIPLEEIFANLPNITQISIWYGSDSRNVSSDTSKKLFQLPHFKNVTKFDVYHVSENFDIAPIYDQYFKNRSRFTFSVYYQNGLSEGFTKKLDGIVHEILVDRFLKNETPLIRYHEQSDADYYGLKKMHKKSLKKLQKKLLFPLR